MYTDLGAENRAEYHTRLHAFPCSGAAAAFPNMRSGGASPESRLQSAAQHNHHHLAPLIEYGWALRGLTISYRIGHTLLPIHRSVHGRDDGDTNLCGSRLGLSNNNYKNSNCNFGDGSRRCLFGAS